MKIENKIFSVNPMETKVMVSPPSNKAIMSIATPSVIPIYVSPSILPTDTKRLVSSSKPSDPHWILDREILGGGKVDITPTKREHPPVHFNYEECGERYRFVFETCEPMDNTPGKIIKKVKEWYNRGGRERVKQEWNRSISTDCTIGPIRE